LLIDWFTIIAQIINFLILLFLLRRFLYRPILNAMDEREKKITLSQREAQRTKQEAQKEVEEYHHLNQEIRAQREHLYAQAEAEAEEQRKTMLRDARHEVEHAQAAWYRAVQQEKESLLHELNQSASRQTLAIARRALAELADRDLEGQIVEEFLRRLKQLEISQKQIVTDSFSNPGHNLQVRTSFRLSDEQMDRIKHTVRDYLDYERTLEFDVDPNLLCGIELKTPGQKISWSLASYLDDLEESMFEAFREKQREQALDAQTQNGPAASGAVAI
jgi:F-type H+-transporting ATPase subunit b